MIYQAGKFRHRMGFGIVAHATAIKETIDLLDPRSPDEGEGSSPVGPPRSRAIESRSIPRCLGITAGPPGRTRARRSGAKDRQAAGQHDDEAGEKDDRDEEGQQDARRGGRPPRRRSRP